MTEGKNVISSYVHLVDFIAGIAGSNCEVVLHDIEDVDHSIIAIKNNHISGRGIGGPITDFGLKLIKEKTFEKENFILNYPSKTRDGKTLRSSTYFIKGDNGELVGMLCVNVNLTGFLEAKKLIDGFIMGLPAGNTDGNNTETNNNEVNTIENFHNSIEDIIKESIEKTHIPPERLSPDEKMSIVQELIEKGVFLLKGSVAEVAKQLKVSENTVYRYLNKKE